MRALVGHRLLMISVGVVLIFDAQGRLLLGRRTDDGEWGAVGGIMEPGETIEETARRETREEVGLELGELTFLGVGSGPEYAHTYPNGDQVISVCVVYAARYTGAPIVPDPAEVLEAAFFAPDALPAGHRPSVDRYLRMAEKLDRRVW